MPSAHGMTGVLAVAALILGDPAVAAADLPGVRLDVARSPGAESCPTAKELESELRARRTETARVNVDPLYVSIQMDLHDDRFVATMQVSGRKRGIRSLSGAGPGCGALREALVVSLLVLLDEEPDRPALARPTPALAPPTVASEPALGPKGGIWVSGGGAATHGLPLGLSAAVFADVTLRFPIWEVSAGGFFAPGREIDFPPGRVLVSAFGGRARACLNLPLAEAVQLSGCGLGLIASLGGEASGFSDSDSKRRPWWLVGAGPELRFFASDMLAFGLFGALLATGHGESFSIDGLESRGPAYETDSLVGWLGIDGGVRIW